MFAINGPRHAVLASLRKEFTLDFSALISAAGRAACSSIFRWCCCDFGRVRLLLPATVVVSWWMIRFSLLARFFFSH